MRNFREYYLECFEAERPKFIRVLKAVPADQAAYRPHPRSTSAGDLVWLLASELGDGCELIDRGEVSFVLRPAPAVPESVAAFERLSGREQSMLLFVIAGLASLFMLLGGYFISKDLKLREARIEAKAKSLAELGALRSDYSRRLAAQNRLAEQIRKNNTVRLLSYIEEVSRAASISLDNAAERGGQTFKGGPDACKYSNGGARLTCVNPTFTEVYDKVK